MQKTEVGLTVKGLTVESYRYQMSVTISFGEYCAPSTMECCALSIVWGQRWVVKRCNVNRETWDVRNETWDVRSEMWDVRCEKWELRTAMDTQSKKNGKRDRDRSIRWHAWISCVHEWSASRRRAWIFTPCAHKDRLEHLKKSRNRIFQWSVRKANCRPFRHRDIELPKCPQAAIPANLVLQPVGSKTRRAPKSGVEFASSSKISNSRIWTPDFVPRECHYHEQVRKTSVWWWRISNSIFNGENRVGEHLS